MQSSFHKKLLFISIAVLLIAVVCIAGCVQTENPEEKVLHVVSYVGPDTGGSLDPSFKWVGWYVRQAGIYESLFSFDTEMNLQPELASSYRQLSYTEWEVTLRDDVYFHDGTKMNADAVIYSINRVLTPTNSRYEEYAFVDEVYKTGEYTIVIKTKEPYAPAIYAFADPVMSIVSPNASNLEKEPVGTGPYMFVSFEPSTSLELKVNDKYWGGKPKLDRISIIYNTDPATRSFLLMSGDVDISWNFQYNAYAGMDADPNINAIKPEAGTRTEFLYVNEKNAPFNDVRVRQAISYALNRTELVDTALEGVGAVPAVGIFSSAISWSAYDDLTNYDNNQEKALELFAEAGIKKGTDGKLYYNGEPFTINLLISTKRSSSLPTANVVATQLEQLGVTVSIRVVDYSALASECKKGNYDLSMASWITAPSGDPDYFLTTQYLTDSTYAQWTGFSNSELDAKILKARTMFDNEKRYALYDDIQHEIQDDMTLIPLTYITNLFALNKDVTGFKVYPNELTVITKDIGIS
jgi:peptide/nickel transport system substrate-binding protein